jgi:hypothetical protein
VPAAAPSGHLSPENEESPAICDAIEDAASEVIRIRREIAEGETPILSEFGPDGFYHWVWVDDASAPMRLAA